MPKALVINPNTSQEMTAEIKETATRAFRSSWECEVLFAPAGPESLESWTDYHLASVCVLPVVEAYQAEADGIVLACFGDPGLYLLKEYCEVPVVGIAEASMSLAILLGAKFGILAGMRRAVELMDSMVRTYGMEARYAGTESLDMRVLDFDQDRGKTLDKLTSTSLRLRQRGAEVLLLGCAGLTSFVEALQSRVDMPVIDPVNAGCQVLQTLHACRLNTSHIGLYSHPAPQRMNQLEDLYTEDMIKVLTGKRKTT
jgi:allantoin racemase